MKKNLLYADVKNVVLSAKAGKFTNPFLLHKQKRFN